MPAHSPIQFYTDRYWTNPDAASYMKLYAPPSPSRLPMRRSKQRHRTPPQKSPIRRRTSFDGDDVGYHRHSRRPAEKPPVQHRASSDDDVDVNQQGFSRPRRPSRTLPSRIPSFVDVEMNDQRSQPPIPEWRPPKHPERDRLDMPLKERRPQPPIAERRPHSEWNHLDTSVRDVQMTDRRSQPPIPERRPNRMDLPSRDVRMMMDRRSQSPNPEGRRPKHSERSHLGPSSREIRIMDNRSSQLPIPERRPPDFSERNRLETEVSVSHDTHSRDVDSIRPTVASIRSDIRSIVEPQHDELIPQRNVLQSTGIPRASAREPEPERPRKMESIPDTRRSDRDLVSNLLKELLDTEIRYVNDLRILKEFYLDPIVEMAEDAVSAIISMEQTRICFLDPTDIIAIHQDLMAQLSGALSDRYTTAQQVSIICTIFNDVLDRLRWPYTNYLAMFASSTQLLTRLRLAVPALNKLLDEIWKESTHEIGSLAILPVQRLPRYELFLDRLEHHTTGSRRVAKTRSAITKLVQDIDMVSSATSPLEKLQWEEFNGHINLVSASRTLIRIGDCRLLLENTSAFWTRNGRSAPAAVIILCNDTAAFATRISGGGLRLHSVIALRDMRAIDMNDDGDYRNLVGIQGYNKTVTICCDTPADKGMWLEELRKATDDAKKSYEQEDLELLQLTVAIDLVQT